MVRFRHGLLEQPSGFSLPAPLAALVVLETVPRDCKQQHQTNDDALPEHADTVDDHGVFDEGDEQDTQNAAQNAALAALQARAPRTVAVITFSSIPTPALTTAEFRRAAYRTPGQPGKDAHQGEAQHQHPVDADP